jgi:hypothetical protein
VTTKSTAHFDTTITIMGKKPALTVSSSYDWGSDSGDSTVHFPGGAISTAWSTFIGDKAYAKGGASSSWGEMRRSALFAHNIGRTPMNDPSLLITWLDGAEVVSGDARSMVLRIPVPVAIRYIEPSIRAQAAEAFRIIGSEGMEGIVTFDDAGHIVSMALSIRGANHFEYQSNVTKLSGFGKVVAHSAPSSPLPMAAITGVLFG